MIDKEQSVYEYVHQVVTTRHAGIRFAAVPPGSVAVRPYVSVEMIDNELHNPTYDMRGNENSAIHVFEVNVYSNRPNMAKLEAKGIFHSVDTAFNELGYQRISFAQIIPTAGDARLVGRFRGLEVKNKKGEN